MSDIVAYRIDPIYPNKAGDPIGFATACVMSCMVTGKMLSGSGGGGYYLSPEAYAALLEEGGHITYTNLGNTADNPYAYRISPIQRHDAEQMVAMCIMKCMVSGETLNSSGGGGDYISPAIFERLRTEYRSRNR